MSFSLPHCNRVLLINPKFRFRAAINIDNDNSANPEDEEVEEEEGQCIQDTGKAVVNKSESESGTSALQDWKKDPISKFQGMITTLPPFVFVVSFLVCLNHRIALLGSMNVCFYSLGNAYMYWKNVEILFSW